MIYYAGIGSRETPPEVLEIFKHLARYLAKKGTTLRSGHADGADMAFEIGCDAAGGHKEIYIPWSGFNGSTSGFVVTDEKAFALAESFHPYWRNLKQGARKLHARNAHQILGKDLNTPSDFVVCWTKDGKDTGGTAQAIRMARHYDVPICNAGKFGSAQEIKDALNNFVREVL